MNRRFYGWKLLAALCVIQAFIIGFTAYAGSIMNTYMMIELHADRKSLGLATASFGLCMGLFSPLTGYLVHRRGARAMICAGTSAAALGALAMATTVGTLAGVMIVYGLVMGSAAALSGGIPSQTIASHWFRKRLAVALTALSIGASIGGFVATPLLSKVVVAHDGNWRMGWFVVAAVCAVAFLCAILFVRNKPADIGQVQDGAVAEADSTSGAKAVSPPAAGVYKTAEDWTFREAVRHVTFWVMIFCVVCATSATGMMFAHGVAHFKDLGHSPGMAAIFLSTLIFAGLGGKGIFGILGDRIEPRFLWSAALILAAIGMALVINATSEIELYASAVLLGMGPAVACLGMFTLAANYYGKTPYPQLMGVTGLFMTLIPAMTTVLTGIVFDRFGSYTSAFISTAVICVLGSLTMLFVVPPTRRPVAL